MWASVDSAPVSLDSDYYGGYTGEDNSAQNKLDNQIESKEEFDFWAQLGSELEAILSSGDKPAKTPIINKNAGLITITATSGQIKRVKEYLKAVQERLQKQIFIDVSIIAVELKDGYTNGVDWSRFDIGFDSYINKDDASASTPSSIIFNKGSPDAPAKSLKGANGGFVFGTNLNFNLDGMINFLSTNGSVKVISSPKIATLNNQPALISVGDSINYNIAESYANHSSSSAFVQTSYKQRSIFVGVLLNILPQISDDGRIMMRINPSLSGLKFQDDDKKQNEPRQIAPDTVQKKLSTVISAHSGETVVIGGLIAETSAADINKIPVLGDVPILGYLFKSEASKTTRTELIFVITPSLNGDLSGFENGAFEELK